MESDPRPWIRALRHSHDRLASLVQLLDAEEIRGPSYHDWTIAQVLSHLGSGAELGLESLNAAVDGREAPGRETFQPVWDAWNARTPEQQVADGIAYDERLVQRFESLTNEELGRIHLSLFGMELDAAGVARLRLSEHAIHTWDVAVALDPAAVVAPDAVALLIDTAGQLARRLGKPQGKRFQLTVHTRAPERYFSLEVGDEVVLTERESSASAELQIPAEAFLRLVYGRLDPNHTPLDVAISGDLTLDDLRSIFPGF